MDGLRQTAPTGGKGWTSATAETRQQPTAALDTRLSELTMAAAAGHLGVAKAVRCGYIRSRDELV